LFVSSISGNINTISPPIKHCQSRHNTPIDIMPLHIACMSEQNQIKTIKIEVWPFQCRPQAHLSWVNMQCFSTNTSFVYKRVALICILLWVTQTHHVTCEMNGPSWFFNLRSFPRPFSATVGNDRRRSVWPVGAVSNTTTEKFIVFTNLQHLKHRMNVIALTNLMFYNCNILYLTVEMQSKTIFVY